MHWTLDDIHKDQHVNANSIYLLHHKVETMNRTSLVADEFDVIYWNLAGPRWAKYFVAPLQFAICYGAVIAGPLVGGQSLKVRGSFSLI